MKVVAVLLFVLVAIANCTNWEDNGLWKKWKQQYGKVYGSETEENTRYNNFVVSVRRIQTENMNATNKIFGLNKFSDLSPSEFRNSFLMTPFVARHRSDVSVAVPSKTQAPASLDWRTMGGVTPVKDQQQCGSCWAFSVAETLESANLVAKKVNVSIRVSEQQIVDCDNTDGGCNGGNPETAWDYIIGTGGLDSEASYPYTAADGTCKFKKANVVASVSSWKYATSSGDEKTLQNNLVSKPLSICVDAANWQDYTTGIMTAWECAWIVTLDHCVELVGYSTTDGSTPYWIVRNSWGTGWGEQGYIRLTMNENTCGLTEESTIPTV